MAPGMTPVLEHADFFVFNKPAGISFHSEDGAGFLRYWLKNILMKPSPRSQAGQDHFRLAAYRTQQTFRPTFRAAIRITCDKKNLHCPL